MARDLENEQGKPVELPRQRNFEQAFKLSLDLVQKELADAGDAGHLAQKAGASHKESPAGNWLEIMFLNQLYRISWPSLEAEPALSPREYLLILHYLAKSASLGHVSSPTGSLVSYQQLPPGLVYNPVFTKRAIRPLVQNFAEKPGTLTGCAEKFGGKNAPFGDEAVTIPVLPKVPVTFVLWRGDDEFEPDGNILFEEGILDYLPAEDVTVLCEILAWKLVKSC